MIFWTVLRLTLLLSSVPAPVYQHLVFLFGYQTLYILSEISPRVKMFSRHKPHAGRRNHPGRDQTEWSRLLLSDVVYSARVTMRHAAERTIPSLRGEGGDGSARRVLSLVTLTLDRVIRHTVVHQSSSCIYISNFIEIGTTFLWTQGPVEIQDHVTQKLGQITKIRRDQI